MDVLDTFKHTQREGWAYFAPLELLTTPAAAQLVAFARVRAEDGVLDVGCRTGVVAVTAARRGARVPGLDLTPELLERARKPRSVQARVRRGRRGIPAGQRCPPALPDGARREDLNVKKR